MLGQHDVAGLFAAEAEPALVESFDDIAIAHLGLDHLDALFLHRQTQTQVRHHGSNQSVVAQVGITFHADGQNRHDLITVNDVAFGIDC